MDLGYLTVHAAAALGTRHAQAGRDDVRGRPAGTLRVEGDNILLGKPFTFTKDNIDHFDF